ncbi:uncharacterized protein [Epargyreus clarus]|uniref:uncharacterized protein n=1 Tax=Epargyreus clarus TaxID=520877 RepID=UPI003C2D9563
MGKNSKSRNRRISASQSTSSVSQKSGSSRVSVRKLKSLQNKKRHRSKKKIQQLFERLRNETEYEASMSLESGNNTVIELNDTTMKENQMITPIKSRTRTNPSLIIINDDDDLVINPCKDPLTPKGDINSSPMHSSTPIQNKINSQKNSQASIHTVNNNNIAQNLNSENNATKIINRDSYLTIDLTSETLKTQFNETNANTVIDLVNNTETSDVVEVSQNSSMSGDSQVTVLQNKKSKINGKQMEKFMGGIAKLSSTERGKLLEVIAKKIFNDTDSSSHLSLKSIKNRATETEEDTYIKEVILGQKPSRNSIGSNIYNPQRDIRNRSGLRMIVIDGSNVAMQHSMGRVFSVKGLKICIEYFVHRGHIVKAFVPQFRCQLGKSTDGKLLDSLERQGLVVYTPSRKVQDKLISSYDDRYIVQCAAEFDGVIVSRDNYRDLLQENPRWRYVIENRLLQFTWVGDLIMFPKDPLGRNGPTLEEFLRHPIVIEHPLVL